MQKKFTTFVQHPLFIVFNTFLAFGLAVLFEWAQDYVGFVEIFMGMGFVLFIVIFGVVITTLLNKIKHEEEFSDKLTDLKNVILTSNMTWLVSEKYVSVLERESQKTWVFTTSSRFMNDLDPEGEIYETVKANLAQGKSYIYFLAKNPESIKLVNDFCHTHSFEEGQVLFYLVPPAEFLFYTEIAIYNVDEKYQRAIEWLPVEKLQYYIEMDPAHTDRVLTIGHVYLNEYKPHKSS